MTLGACKRTIFKKRRSKYSEKNPSSHILSVDAKIHSTYGFTETSKDRLAWTSYDIINLDHIKTSKEIDVLAATCGTTKGDIEIFKLTLSGDGIDDDDSAKLSAQLSYPVSNLDSAYFLDENRIIFKTTGSGDIKCI